MSKKQFVKIDTDILNGERTRLLVREMGMEGVGVFLSLIIMLKQQRGYRVEEMKLPHIAKRWGVEVDKMDRVVYGYGLFGRDMVEGKWYMSSLDLNLVMAKVVEGIKNRKNTVNVPERGENGQFMVKNRISFTTTTTTNINNINKMGVMGGNEERVVKLGYWEQCIDRAMEDMVWLEVVAMNNRLPIRERLEDMVAIFKRHARAQGKEGSILSVQDAKEYFANYARMGKPTYKDLMRQLANSTPRETDPDSPYAERAKYRWEEVDRVTGERSYYGVRIPKEAPPRPSEYAVWHEGKWEG